ncbi:helix-turn-helix domain-containing protein [Megalodesulfovibrio gigas]|uniref:Putative sensory box protein n=1 Tax=Megalodesulfovibrio gigas (strain ATCC 19364 / DSM 1382 / NCIMB 9332 / VKM B-1759) TaxID=1121448 RepID=T2GBM9_MEGG1|nr:helix-turn-helix domain-containing protein [Megalodesulfovibrio gigas]AGW13536.1 putative sensory box protein [Megalodesulfovibrio gigas DSM 1382 = ATCC 19364]
MDGTAFKKAFGKRLRFLRELRSLTQARLAERIGVTEQYISMLERGLSAPSFSLVAQLSRTLDAHPAALFLFPRLEGEEAPPLPLPTLPENLSRVAHWVVDPQGVETISAELASWLPAQPAGGGRGSRGDKSATPVSLFSHVPPEDARRIQEALQAAAAGNPAPLFSFRLLADPPLRILAYAVQQPDASLRMVLMDVSDHLRLKQTQLDLQAAVEALAEERTRQLQETVAQLEEEVRRRRESEAALAAAEAHWRILFDHAPVGIFQSVPEGRFHAVNHEALRMFGYDSHEEILAMEDIGRQLYVDPSHRSELLEMLLRQGAIDDYAVTLKAKDGRTFRAAITARLLPPAVSADGHKASFIGFVKALPLDDSPAPTALKA